MTTENETLAKNLSDLWGRPGHDRVFPVNAPVKLTECAAGRFHKKSYIGEEELRPFAAYVGKKGGVIIKLREVDGDAANHIEMTVNEACEHLEGFTNYYVETTTNMEDLLLQEYREVAKAKEEAAHIEARRAADPLFGSWS